MPVSSPDKPSIEELAEEFLERRRRGERPSLDEYAARYPDLAGEIREFFPVLGLVEDFKPATGDVTGSIAGATVTGVGTQPERLGDFRLLRSVGRGGMGVVYEAEQESLGRRVALKVLRSHRLHDPLILIRFHREAKAAARLHHTNIVPVFGVGEHEGAHFYVMQFILGLPLDAVLDEVRRLRGLATKARDGSRRAADSSTATGHPAVTDLAQSLATGRFVVTEPTEAGLRTVDETPPSSRGDGSSVGALELHGFSAATDSARVYARSVARVGVQVAEALDYAHRHGILHRDIKPSNLLLDPHGTVWVTDFGLAKVASDSDLTRTGDVVGTIRYMAPERFEGRCDVRADIYALGLTLYELLALRPAFGAEDRNALIREMTQEEPRSLRQVDPTVPRDLDTIIHKAIARDPKDRYATAADLRDELERFLSDRPIRSRPVSSLERYWRWCRRNPWLAVSNIAAAVLTTTLAIVSTIAAWNYGIQNRRISDELDKVKKTEQAAKEQEFEARVAQARAGRFSRQAGQRFESLKAVAKASRIRVTPELREEAIACMALPDLELERSIRFERDTDPFDVSPAFDRYAVGYRNGEVIFYRSDDQREILRLKCPGPVMQLTFSSDGAHLRASHVGPDGQIAQRIWDIRDERCITSVEIEAGDLTAVSHDGGFTPEGKFILGITRDNTLGRFDVETGRLVKEAKFVGRVIVWSPSPDGRCVAYLAENARDSVRIFDIEKGVEVASLPAYVGVGSVAWSADGRLLAVGGSEGTIRLWDTEQKTLVSSLEGHRHLVSSLVFMHASGLLISSSWDGSTRLWDPVRGRLLVTLRGSGGDIWRVSADERQVFHSSWGWGPTFLRIDTGRECRVLQHGLVGNRSARPYLGGIRSTAFSVDGRWLASAGFDGVHVWDCSTGQGIGHLPLGSTLSAAFSPDGRHFHTFGKAGFWLWPVTRSDPASANGLRIGPPRSLNLVAGLERGQAAWDGTGRFFVATDPMRQQSVVFDAEKAVEIVRDASHPGLAYAAISPDGRWVASTTWKAGPGRIWEVATRQVVKTFSASSQIAFSPDGCWFAESDNSTSIRLWHVGTWLPGPEIEKQNGGTFRFSPDSRLIASFGADFVELIDVNTRRHLATLASPPEASPGVTMVSFSPDGGQLAVGTSDPSVLLWDLRLVRRQLAELGLDWDAPPIPESVTDRTELAASRSLKVDFGPMTGHLEHYSVSAGPLVERYIERIKRNPDDSDAYHHRAHAFLNLNRDSEALADVSRAILLRPNDAHLYLLRAQVYAGPPRKLEPAIDDLESALKLDPSEDLARRLLAEYCNELAWKLATISQSPLNLDKALKLSLRSVNLVPGQQLSLNTRGVVLYRAGQYTEAISVLEKSLEAGKGQLAGFDLFFLASAHHRLGHRELARRYFDRAVEWVRRQSSLPEGYIKELQAFRAEAELLLRATFAALPDDVFAGVPGGPPR
jgi:serine/threonine protein kinase/WD40 repeat protein/tetratricopeptide (TPR) repeat protein